VKEIMTVCKVIDRGAALATVGKAIDLTRAAIRLDSRSAAKHHPKLQSQQVKSRNMQFMQQGDQFTSAQSRPTKTYE
jgi:hypothetical protein